jgi:hypothetical protein
MSDYLAIIPIGGGSSWGRAPDREKAIGYAIKSLKDWQSLFVVANTEVIINVVDVDGYDHCFWGGYPGGWLRGVNNVTGEEEVIDRPIEAVTRVTPNWRTKR